MQIVDEQGTECPVGVEGEIVVDLSLTRPVGLFTRYVVGYKRQLFSLFFFFSPFLFWYVKVKYPQHLINSTVNSFIASKVEDLQPIPAPKKRTQRSE